MLTDRYVDMYAYVLMYAVKQCYKEKITGRAKRKNVGGRTRTTWTRSKALQKTHRHISDVKKVLIF